MQKELVLTIDYELFFGKKSGTVQNCMLKPTDLLMNLLDKYQSKMTIFWDILHYWKLLQLEKLHPEQKKDRTAIKSQICDMVKRGHDVQLHIHPHWLDTDFEKGEWCFSYDRYALHDLKADPHSTDINTINGCLRISRIFIEEICSISIV